MTIETINLPRPRWNVITATVVLHLGALLAFLPGTFNWAAVGVAFFLHWVTLGLGITLGFHRLVSHRSFRAPKWLEYFLILCGSLSGQGGVLGWVGFHRMHHRYSDQGQDPHDSTKGFWWSHISWLMHDVPMRSQLEKYTQDISADPFYQFCHKHYIFLQVALAVVLYMMGGMPFLVWGTFVRLFFGFHCTCFVNSACHQWGYRMYETSDNSTNCWWVALVTYGEGWHNNHHAFQHSARHGLRWWEFDLTWWTIRGLEKLRIVSHVKTQANR
jgi:sn-1 stearoyl-lipid 9-desaturase